MMAMNGDSRRPYEEAAYFVVQSGHLFKQNADARRKIKQDIKSGYERINCKPWNDIYQTSLCCDETR
jgi:hypothetical protein